MFVKNVYCTLDTETFGGASKPKGIYHLGGIIHDRKGEIFASFNYLIAEHYEEIEKDSYAKKNFNLYLSMIENGGITMISTEDRAIQEVEEILKLYGVNFMCAYNSGFDFCKTKCKKLIEDREFIDIWLMALETLVTMKAYQNFCHENGFQTKSKKSCSTTAENVYAFITQNENYQEEHTAFEDSKIELAIFLACLSKHKKFTRNQHCFDVYNWGNLPKW